MSADVRHIFVRYDEIALKKGSRAFFEKRLRRNISRQLSIPIGRVRRIRGRLVVDLTKDDDLERFVTTLRRCFGARKISPVSQVAASVEAIRESGLAHAASAVARGARSFKVRASRSDKSFGMRSTEMNPWLGEQVLLTHDALRVDVHNPDFELRVEVFKKHAFVYSESLDAAGGLPVGTLGYALALLSGGIDSPVAMWMGQKRGLHVDAVYFHSFPFTGDKTKQKVLDLAQVIARTCPEPIYLHVASATEFQKALNEHCREGYWTLLLRRFMIRVASAVAIRRGHGALITGDCLGQVASQTLENLCCTEGLSSLPLLRPLVSLDKYEIIERAQHIGSYETSILPYQDCCTVFAPKHPATRGRREICEQEEARLPVDALVDATLAGRELYRVTREGVEDKTAQLAKEGQGPLTRVRPI